MIIISFSFLLILCLKFLFYFEIALNLIIVFGKVSKHKKNVPKFC